jgi:hypothetical protein
MLRKIANCKTAYTSLKRKTFLAVQFTSFCRRGRGRKERLIVRAANPTRKRLRLCNFEDVRAAAAAAAAAAIVDGGREISKIEFPICLFFPSTFFSYIMV